MVPSHRRSSRRLVSWAVAWRTLTTASLLSCCTAFAQQVPDVRLSRYTTTSAAPEIAQLDPMEAVVQIGFPRANVQSVGDAIAYLLLRTGYRLAPQEEADAHTKAVVAMPLPEVHRRLGPYSVRTALSVLLGRPFVVSVDPMQRLVSYGVDAAPGRGSAAVTAMSRPESANAGAGSER